jgi:ABC-type transport system substrate-binding protein
MVGLAVYDPIAAYNDKTEAKPYLAETFTPNADFTQWTIKLRSGVKFSNGTPLTSDAIVKLFDAHLKSPLTKPVFSDLKDYSATDDLTVVFNMKSPWVVFPTTLTAQTGVVPEPGTLGDTGAAPIGSGPFVQTEWVKDSAWKGKKNPTYWRKDKDGTQLPYLDNVEFRPIPDQESRNKSLQGGTLNMMHTSDTKGIKLFREAAAGKVQMIEDNGEGEEGFIIMNQAKAPFDSVDARRALAYATDATAYGQDTNEGILEPADGVFKNSPWYAPSKNYPTYDLAGQGVVEKTKQHGRRPPSSSASAPTARSSRLPPVGVAGGRVCRHRQGQQPGELCSTPSPATTRRTSGASSVRGPRRRPALVAVRQRQGRLARCSPKAGSR